MRPQTARFAELAQRDDDSVPLDEAALLIAAHAYPSLDLAGELERLDRLAAGCPGDELDVVLEYLFGECGFTGNRLEYYDPRNSFLNEVLERRLGIPITLAVVAMEVGRRVGLPLLGVGMPGHFLVRYGPVLVDPFTGGRRLSEDDCRGLVGGGEIDPSLLAPVGSRTILVRMLANLRQIYLQASDARSLEWVLALRTAVPGVDPAELTQLARVRVNLGMFAEAADALENLATLSTVTDPAGAERLEARARLLRARLN